MCYRLFTHLLFVGITVLVGGASAGEYCTFYHFSQYCSNGCCEDDCCEANSDTVLVLIIVGSVFGGLLVISAVIAFVCCFIKTGKRTGHVIAPAQGNEPVTLLPPYNHVIAETNVYGYGHSPSVFTTDLGPRHSGVHPPPYSGRLPPINSHSQPRPVENQLTPSAPGEHQGLYDDRTGPPAPAVCTTGHM